MEPQFQDYAALAGFFLLGAGACAAMPVYIVRELRRTRKNYLEATKQNITSYSPYLEETDDYRLD